MEDGNVNEKWKGWTWRELPPGCPLYASVEDLKAGKAMKDLYDGDEVITLTFFGYIKAKITKDEYGFQGESDGLIFKADFSKEHDCWVQYATMNPKAIEKLVKLRPPLKGKRNETTKK